VDANCVRDNWKGSHNQVPERIGDVVEAGPLIRDFGALPIGQTIERLY
jgi:hypothetical protein